MLIAERDQAEGTIFTGGFFVPNGDQRLLQQRDDCGQDLFARQAFQPQMSGDRQGAAELDNTSVLLRITDLALAGMIPVLFPTAGVAAGRLQVAVG